LHGFGRLINGDEAHQVFHRGRLIALPAPVCLDMRDAGQHQATSFPLTSMYSPACLSKIRPSSLARAASSVLVVLPPSFALPISPLMPSASVTFGSFSRNQCSSSIVACCSSLRALRRSLVR